MHFPLIYTICGCGKIYVICECTVHVVISRFLGYKRQITQHKPLEAHDIKHRQISTIMRQVHCPKYRPTNLQRPIISTAPCFRAMGSTGALIYNPYLNNNTLCFKCLNSNALSKTISDVKQRKHKLLTFSSRDTSKRFSRTVCSAVEDATEKQRGISGSGIPNGAGPAVQDRLGKV